MTTPSKDRGDLIREHGERIATLDERIDHLRRDFDRVQNSLEAQKKSLQDFDKRFEVTIKDVERLVKKLDDVSSRRWDLWKIVLAAILGAVLANGGAIIRKATDSSLQQKQVKP